MESPADSTVQRVPSANIGIAHRVVQPSDPAWNSLNGGPVNQPGNVRSGFPVAYALVPPAHINTFFPASNGFFPGHFPLPALGRDPSLFLASAFGSSAYPYFINGTAFPSNSSNGPSLPFSLQQQNNTVFQYPLHHLTDAVRRCDTELSYPAQNTFPNDGRHIDLDRLPARSDVPDQPEDTGNSADARKPPETVSKSGPKQQSLETLFPIFDFDDEERGSPQDLSKKRFLTEQVEGSADTVPNVPAMRHTAKPAALRSRKIKRNCFESGLTIEKVPPLLELFAANRAKSCKTFPECAAMECQKTDVVTDNTDYWDYLQTVQARNRLLDKTYVETRSVLSTLPLSVRHEIEFATPKKLSQTKLDAIKLRYCETQISEEEAEICVESSAVDCDKMCNFAKHLCSTSGEETVAVKYPEESEVVEFLRGVGLVENTLLTPVASPGADQPKEKQRKHSSTKKRGMTGSAACSLARVAEFKKRTKCALQELKGRMVKLKAQISAVKNLARTDVDGNNVEDLLQELGRLVHEN